ncbi:hypothetical protein F66182_11127, partial [Fusarium sp. NRRL 66182]
MMLANDLSFNFHEEAGLAFCRDYILSNTHIRDVLGAIGSDEGSPYTLVLEKFIAPDPNHIQTLRNGGDKLDYLVVQAWPKKSKAIFYSGSHTSDFTRIVAANTFWEVARAQLQGCTAESCSFEQGGFVIFDARVLFERQEQRSYAYVYVKSSVLPYLLQQERKLQRRYWGMQPPASCDPDELA